MKKIFRLLCFITISLLLGFVVTKHNSNIERGLKELNVFAVASAQESEIDPFSCKTGTEGAQGGAATSYQLYCTPCAYRYIKVSGASECQN